jgi:hypothetical protein
MWVRNPRWPRAPAGTRRDFASGCRGYRRSQRWRSRCPPPGDLLGGRVRRERGTVNHGSLVRLPDRSHALHGGVRRCSMSASRNGAVSAGPGGGADHAAELLRLERRVLVGEPARIDRAKGVPVICRPDPPRAIASLPKIVAFCGIPPEIGDRAGLAARARSRLRSHGELVPRGFAVLGTDSRRWHRCQRMNVRLWPRSDLR